MTEDYKKLWGYMTTETRKRARAIAMNEFQLSSEVAFDQNWIYRQRTPEAHKIRLVEIFKKELVEQNKEVEQIG